MPLVARLRSRARLRVGAKSELRQRPPTACGAVQRAASDGDADSKRASGGKELSARVCWPQKGGRAHSTDFATATARACHTAALARSATSRRSAVDKPESKKKMLQRRRVDCRPSGRRERRPARAAAIAAKECKHGARVAVAARTRRLVRRRSSTGHVALSSAALAQWPPCCSRSVFLVWRSL